jgi:hypothetical protein
MADHNVDEEAVYKRLKAWSRDKPYINFPGIREFMAYVFTHDKDGRPIEEGGPLPIVGFNEKGEGDLDRAYELAVSVLGARVLQ